MAENSETINTAEAPVVVSKIDEKTVQNGGTSITIIKTPNLENSHSKEASEKVEIIDEANAEPEKQEHETKNADDDAISEAPLKKEKETIISETIVEEENEEKEEKTAHVKIEEKETQPVDTVVKQDEIKTTIYIQENHSTKALEKQLSTDFEVVAMDDQLEQTETKDSTILVIKDEIAHTTQTKKVAQIERWDKTKTILFIIFLLLFIIWIVAYYAYDTGLIPILNDK